MDESGLHILIVTSWYPSAEEPVYGIFVEEQAKLLQRKGHHVQILHIALSGTFLESLGKGTELRRENFREMRVTRLQVSPRVPKLRGLNYGHACKIARRHMHTLYPDRMPDVIHSHALFIGGIVAANLSRHFDIPFVHTEHTSQLIHEPQAFHKDDRKFLKSTYASAKKVLFVSRFLQEEIQRIYNPDCKAAVLPNVVQNAFFELEAAPEKDGKTLISLGGLLPVKNYTLLLEAMHHVCATEPDVRLTIYGEGPEEALLRDKIHSLGLQAHVQIQGRLNRTGVLEAMQEASIAVSSSRTETFGLTIAEAMAAGLPVVASDSGGVRDIIDPSAGEITAQTPEALAQSILRTVQRYPEIDKVAIRAYAKSRFHADIIYAELLNLYTSQ